MHLAGLAMLPTSSCDCTLASFGPVSWLSIACCACETGPYQALSAPCPFCPSPQPSLSHNRLLPNPSTYPWFLQHRPPATPPVSCGKSNAQAGIRNNRTSTKPLGYSSLCLWVRSSSELLRSMLWKSPKTLTAAVKALSAGGWCSTNNHCLSSIAKWIKNRREPRTADKPQALVLKSNRGAMC